MTLVTPNDADAVSVSSVEWGLIGRRLLSAMSGSDAPTHPWIESAVSTPPTAVSKDIDEASEDGRERRKLKNEDSSYDSDFDPCESSNSPRPEDSTHDAHEDVSRTASETLAAEFEDYVTLQPSVAPSTKPPIAKALISHAPLAAQVSPTYVSSEPSSKAHQTPVTGTSSPSSQSSTSPATATSLSQKPSSDDSGAPLVSLASVVDSAEYAQQVEFGVKLGYSESLVQLALTKLGSNPDKNELLDELIRLGAGAPKSDSDDDIPYEDELEGTNATLRPIIIDGSNVAMSYGNKQKFCCKGIRLCVDWFRSRGHKEIMVFVPMWRKEPSRPESVITDQEILHDLEKEGILYFTPSRSCAGKRIISYDDRYIIKEAVKSDGVVVSNDNYRDLIGDSSANKRVIESSLLMYSWVNGRFEPPDDPLGRTGPTLDAFLRKSTSGTGPLVTAKDSRPCPYGRKCTYGNKCKYMHPERGTAPVKSVTELLLEKKEKHYQHKAKSRDSSPGEGLRAAKSLSLPTSCSEVANGGKRPLSRTQSSFPSVSHSQPLVVKEEAVTVSSATPHSTVSVSHQIAHPPVSSQSSVDSLTGPLMKGDPQLYSLFSSQRPLAQMGHRIPSPTWQDPSQPNQGAHISIQDNSGGNMHAKLQRQLSINPGGDDRLSKMTKYYSNEFPHANPMSIQQQQQLQMQQQFFQSSSHHHRLENEALANRACVASRCISPSPSYTHGYDVRQNYIHQPLTRHSSSQDSKPAASYSQHILPPCFHSPVGRNLSAPDQIRGNNGQQQQPLMPHIKRLNSTSDSKLHLHGSESQQFTLDCFDDSHTRMSYAHQPIGLSNSSPGPIGSRPISPQQSLGSMMQHQTRIGPQHIAQSASLTLSPHSSNTTEDERLKIFYHLSQLFPEAQVRGALARNPEETDPTKICMSILGLSNCRPISPQQSVNPGVSVSNIPLRAGPSFQPTFSTTGSAPGIENVRDAASAREMAARVEAYTNLSKVFAEEQVRTIMLMYPEETCPTTLCRLIMAMK